MSLEFLSNLNSNPSYELQLPYGAYIAAKMNAELGTTYDLPKILNWCFDRGPLRGWEAITGTWNGSDVDGLIGEANDNGNDYAFSMNGFQHAAALVPLIKYDKRFARSIAKWTLNLANASRLFYPQYLPQTSQDDYLWSSTHDPQSTIAYEALKEKNNFNNNIPLYGTGDAKRNSWAETNLSLYSSSSVGYLASIIEQSDVEGILVLDVNKTDFFSAPPYPSYVVYNPHASDKQVTLNLPGGSHDVYDAISETILTTNASGTVLLTIKMDEAVLVVCIPAGSAPSASNGKLYVEGHVIDHHYGYDFTGSLRIKSMAVIDTLVEFNEQVPVYVATENASAGTVYNWYANGGFIATSSTPAFTWTVPEITGRNVLLLQVELNGKTAIDSIVFTVVENIPTPPIIQTISTDKRWYVIENQAVITCDALDDDDTPAQLTYAWSASAGNIVAQNGAILTWQAPALPGVYVVTCKVTDRSAMSTTQKKMILVKPIAAGESPAFAYYPFDGDANDYSGNDRHATAVGVEAVADARGETGMAYRFNSGDDIIYLVNSAALNFQNEITLSFWINLESLSEESFVLSHGSWEERWKVSVTPNMHMRWTVKTTTGTKDLDSSFPLVFNQFYHFAVVYTGYSLELYADGELDTFSAHSGLLNTTNKLLTFGRKDGNVTRYSLYGTLDEVRLYNTTVLPEEISTLKAVWNDPITGVENAEASLQFYPNPVAQNFYISGVNMDMVKRVNIFETSGRMVNFTLQPSGDSLLITLQDHLSGILIVEIQTQRGVFHKKILVN